MSKLVQKVTITGADDKTDPKKLIELSEKYPFVEWGILVSARQEGSYRFPSRKWIGALLALPESKKLQLSTHLCGRWVRELLRGELNWNEVPDVVRAGQRVQINTHAEEHVAKDGFLDCTRFLLDKQVIFQADGINSLWGHLADAWGLNVAMLVDKSGGAGILPDSWPPPSPDWDTGYAGGLGPDNVVSQIQKIAEKCRFVGFGGEDRPFWIDMERRVRSQDDSYLDMGKVEEVLKLSQPFICDAGTSR